MLSSMLNEMIKPTIHKTERAPGEPGKVEKHRQPQIVDEIDASRRNDRLHSQSELPGQAAGVRRPGPAKATPADAARSPISLPIAA